MTFRLSQQSLNKLQGVHPDLVSVVKLAITKSPVDFTVIEGLRTLERQKELVAAGASRTLNSRHLTGHAVDLAAVVGKEVRWDWPLYSKLAAAMKDAALELKVSIQWGGDWKKFRDGPHFQLDPKRYS
jgi:peptidoglycan L-alanyl-D-glutamate endopeptidase CwlK